MAKLLLKFNAAVIQEIDLEGKPVTVGRKGDNQIVIDNLAVSSHHCRITFEDGHYYIQDLGSTNGTYVNSQRIEKEILRPGDMVGVAKHSLVFLDETAAPKVIGEEDSSSSGEPTVPTALQEEHEELVVASVLKEAQARKTGILRVLKGGFGEPEYELKGISTYIGNSDRVQVRIKAAGYFGSAPEVAASVHRKPEGYVLVAVAEGYPMVNGSPVEGSVILKDGDLIDCGATTLQFVLKD